MGPLIRKQQMTIIKTIVKSKSKGCFMGFWKLSLGRWKRPCKSKVIQLNPGGSETHPRSDTKPAAGPGPAGKPGS